MKVLFSFIHSLEGDKDPLGYSGVDLTQGWATFQDGGPDASNYFFKGANSNKKNIEDSLMMIIIIKLAKEINDFVL